MKSILSILSLLAVSSAVAASTTDIEFKAPYQKTRTVQEGDVIVFFARFSSDPGLFDPVSAFPEARSTDGLNGEVLIPRRGVVRMD